MSGSAGAEVALGATPAGNGAVAFAVWAPLASAVAVFVGGEQTPLEAGARGCWAGVAAARPGDEYVYVLDGGVRYPDPCSRDQPQGVRGPSRVVALAAPGAGPGLDPARLVVPAAGDAEHRRFVRRLLRLRPALHPQLVVEADDAARTLELCRGDVRLLVDFGRETVELRGG